ncbi:MAG: hypothetical protein QF692_07485 [Alphaproteobacteria bacterium]|nr:hypothetical protein [Alphaproteobacteria bacterium]MDP7223089.1 hypothetical protein [Alphaproteobacteria bacterium]
MRFATVFLLFCLSLSAFLLWSGLKPQDKPDFVSGFWQPVSKINVHDREFVLADNQFSYGMRGDFSGQAKIINASDSGLSKALFALQVGDQLKFKEKRTAEENTYRIHSYYMSDQNMFQPVMEQARQNEFLILFREMTLSGWQDHKKHYFIVLAEQCRNETCQV